MLFSPAKLFRDVIFMYTLAEIRLIRIFEYVIAALLGVSIVLTIFVSRAIGLFIISLAMDLLGCSCLLFKNVPKIKTSSLCFTFLTMSLGFRSASLFWVKFLDSATPLLLFFCLITLIGLSCLVGTVCSSIIFHGKFRKVLAVVSSSAANPTESEDKESFTTSFTYHTLGGDDACYTKPDDVCVRTVGSSVSLFIGKKHAAIVYVDPNFSFWKILSSIGIVFLILGIILLFLYYKFVNI